MFSQQSIEDEERPIHEEGQHSSLTDIRYKVVHDPIHKSMTVAGPVLAIVDTPQFQRLRDLKQLGTVYYVYPGATHNRFEHSLGVSYISGQLIDHLAQIHPERPITEEERIWVRLAGAVHDLGHGPFSHVFDGLFVQTLLPGSEWSHEDMSIALFDYLLDDNDLKFLDAAGGGGGDGEGRYDGRQVVKDMVFGAKADKAKKAAAAAAVVTESTIGYGGVGHRDGGSAAALVGRGDGGAVSWVRDPTSGELLVPEDLAAGGASSSSSSWGLGNGDAVDGGSLKAEKPFLFEIVANGISGVDTDKWDYLGRDSYTVGLKIPFDYQRLLYGARIIPATGHIGFHVKQVSEVYSMFATRHHLFRHIYVHRATKAVEYMITDVLLEANNAWDGRLIKAIEDPKEYCRLSDSLLYEIEHGMASRDNPRLKQAHAILSDLRKRKLYRFIDEHLIPKDKEAQYPKEITPELIASHNAEPSVNLRPEDIIVHNAKFNYGAGEKNPVDAVPFYVDYKDHYGRHIPKEKVSHTLPQYFQEKLIRVYSKNRDLAICKAIQKAFRKCLQQYNKSVSLWPDPSSKVFNEAEPEGLPSPANLNVMHQHGGAGGSYYSSSGPLALDAPPRPSTSSGVIVFSSPRSDKTSPHSASSSSSSSSSSSASPAQIAAGVAGAGGGAAGASSRAGAAAAAVPSRHVSMLLPPANTIVGNTPGRNRSMTNSNASGLGRPPLAGAAAAGPSSSAAPSVPVSAVKEAEAKKEEENDRWNHVDEDEDDDEEISASQPVPQVRSSLSNGSSNWTIAGLVSSSVSSSAPAVVVGSKRSASTSSEQLKAASSSSSSSSGAAGAGHKKAKK